MNHILTFLSLAQKAGKVKTGEFLMEKSVKDGTACLVVIAEDTSEKAKARIQRLCDVFGCPTCVFGTKPELGRFTGAKEKSVLSITDSGFAKAFLKKVEQIQGN